MPWRSQQYNEPSRFGVLQPGKIRACDDLNHSAANLDCTSKTPTQLLSWGPIVYVPATLSTDGGRLCYVQSGSAKLALHTKRRQLSPFGTPPTSAVSLEFRCWGALWRFRRDRQKSPMPCGAVGIYQLLYPFWAPREKEKARSRHRDIPPGHLGAVPCRRS